jgi:hypothetical protein
MKGCVAVTDFVGSPDRSVSECIHTVISIGFGSGTELRNPFPNEQNFLMNSRFFRVNVRFFGMSNFYVN